MVSKTNLSILFALIVMFAVFRCDGGEKKDDEASDSQSSETVEQTGTGTLAISTDEIDTGIQVAADNTELISNDFVPASLAATAEAGTIQVGDHELLLQGGGPQFCQNNPSNQMCQDCGPGGSLNGTQQCMEFFCPGGDGYTEGEPTCDGPMGNNDGGPSPDDKGDGGGGKGPCEGMEFLECQPTLVKLYIEMANRAVGQVKHTLEALKEVAKQATFQEGVIKSEDDIHYRIESQTQMEFTVVDHDTNKATAYMLIEDGKYEFQFSMDDGTQIIRVDFTDDQNWLVDVGLYMDDCDPNDVRKPSRINIVMSKQQSVWQGKAMLFSPLWNTPDPTSCNTERTTATEMAIYTDFVGEDAFTTASLYMVTTTTDTLNGDNINNFGIEKICDNFDGFCMGGESVFGSIPGNPFCSTTDGNPAWGAACADATNELVQNGTYLDHSYWVAPKSLGGPTPEQKQSLVE